MTAKKAKAKPEFTDSRTDPAVEAFLRDLDHPLKKDILVVRQMILAASPSIREGIKWNAPSFRTTEFFATIHLRSRERLQIILHTGAKPKARSKELHIADPAGLLEWLATDRCLVTLGAGKDVTNNRAAFQAIVREWVGQV